VPAPVGDLASFAAESFTYDGVAHQIFRKGGGPAVIVITEMPGISPQVLGFADRVVALGCTAVLPDLFGTAGRDPLVAGLTERVAGLRTLASIFHATVDLPVVDLGCGSARHLRTRCRAKARRSGRGRVSGSPGGRGWAGVLRRARVPLGAG